MLPRPVPRITHLQFVVLGTVQRAPRLGRHVRRNLARRGVRRSGPAFYQMMARLEDAGYVTGEYDQKIVGGQIIKERRYTITPEGAAVWQATRDFYLESISEFDAIPATRRGPAHA